MFVGRDDLPQRGGEHLRVRILLLHLRDHGLEGFDLRRKLLAACLRAFEAEAELEVLFIADENIGARSDLMERLRKFLLTAFPE